MTRLLLVFALLTSPIFGQFIQQGPMLIGSGTNVQQGSIALSGDGNTLLVFGTDPSASVWVFTRSNGVWTQTGKFGAPYYYNDGIAISADGTTAIVGNSKDNDSVGAAHVFVRNGNVWTQQAKLVGTGATGSSRQGASVALAADGNTAIVGGFVDSQPHGAFWIFSRTGNTWTQQGPKQIPDDIAWTSYVGGAVSLSADGNTAIVGGSADGEAGGVWFYTRSAGVWTQQGPKHVGSGHPFGAQGASVAMSGDGMTAIVGGSQEQGIGAAWIWVRSGNTWTQQGPKLMAETSTLAYQGRAVAISYDGNTAVTTAPGDHDDRGSAWLWKRTGSTWREVQKFSGPDVCCQTPWEGSWLALSSNGETAALGGFRVVDQSHVGPVWMFAQPADLRVTQSASPVAVAFSGEVTYSVTLTNLGPVAATGVTLTDTIPAQGTLVSSNVSQGSCTGTSTLTCNVGTVASGASMTLTIKMTAPGSPATLTNSASATAIEPDVNTANNTSSLDVAVVQSVPVMSAGLLVLLLLALAAIAWRASA